MLVVLEKKGSSYLNTEIRVDARQFPEEFVSSVFSTLVARSVIEQEISCFCPAVLIDGDRHASLSLFGLLMDGFAGKGLNQVF